jgi:hypothetical protein
MKTVTSKLIMLSVVMLRVVTSQYVLQDHLLIATLLEHSAQPEGCTVKIFMH